jgi:hypothetical protein
MMAHEGGAEGWLCAEAMAAATSSARPTMEVLLTILLMWFPLSERTVECDTRGPHIRCPTHGNAQKSVATPPLGLLPGDHHAYARAPWLTVDAYGG